MVINFYFARQKFWQNFRRWPETDRSHSWYCHIWGTDTSVVPCGLPLSVFFLFYPKDFPCARACSQIISYAILKEWKLCVFPVFGFSKGGSSYGIHYHLRLIRGGQKLRRRLFGGLGLLLRGQYACGPHHQLRRPVHGRGGHRQIRPGGPGHRHPRGQTFDELFQALDACRRCTWTISFSSSRPPTRTLSAGTRRPATPTPHPPGLLPAGGGEAGAPGAGARPAAGQPHSQLHRAQPVQIPGSCSACSAWGRWRRA